ncbi:MAG TPA: methyltransferase domain-containing protein [Acidobacteriaceae bacterium]
MLSEGGKAGALARRAEPDFSVRAQLSEHMDEPCTYDEFRDCLQDLAQVNRLTLAYRPTRIWLDRLLASRNLPGTPLHIVDVGCGQGDMLRMVARWAQRRGIRVQLTGIDLNPYAARAAAEQTPASMGIEWLSSDAFSYTPPSDIDVVISSLFTHHLADTEIVGFLVWMEAVARKGWFINDLHRGRTAFHVFRVLARAARWHPFVQHDGPVSIRRAFAPADWEHSCAQAGLEPGTVRIEQFWPARLCVGRIR